MTHNRMWSPIALAALALLASPAQAAIRFAPAVNTPTGSSGGPGPAAESMIAADLNGDGRPDLVAADWWGTGIRCFLNTGSGFGPALVTELGTTTGSVSAADFDGDQIPDVAVATGLQLIVLRGRGDGRFDELSRRPLTPSGQIQAYAFDTNLDGRIDIVAPTGGGVQTFLGQGNGQFVDGPLSPVAGVITATAQAHFNPDGIPDIALADAFGQRVLMLSGNGDGSFTSFASAFVGFGPEDVAAGDLNGDGIDDVAAADSFSFSMSVVLSTGPGRYGAATRTFGLPGPVSLRLADFDADGDRDIAIPTVIDSRVRVYPNNGTGALGTPLSLPVSNQPQTPAIADYNGDGKPDIATAGPGMLSVLINTSP